jgi:hypothetical protein
MVSLAISNFISLKGGGSTMMMDNMDTPAGDDEAMETESAPDTGTEETTEKSDDMDGEDAAV